LVVVAVVGCCSALVAVSAAELESLRSDRCDDLTDFSPAHP